jgi:hypothetical protein
VDVRRGSQKIVSNLGFGLWSRFDFIRTKESGGDRGLLLNNLASISVPAPCTHRDVVEAIATRSQLPIKIASLSEELNRTALIRGKSIFGLAGDAIDKITVQYEGMRWWISKEGLNIAIVPPTVPPLSRFDRLAGKLYVDKSKNGALSKELLMAIATKLDTAQFSLKRELQRAQWKTIALHNQTYSDRPIKTFKKACQPMFARYVRKRLYLARDRYLKAYPPVIPLPTMSAR